LGAYEVIYARSPNNDNAMAFQGIRVIYSGEEDEIKLTTEKATIPSWCPQKPNPSLVVALIFI
jgi:hypothetical protein